MFARFDVIQFLLVFALHIEFYQMCLRVARTFFDIKANWFMYHL